MSRHGHTIVQGYMNNDNRLGRQVCNLHANPQTAGRTGTRSCWVSESGEMRHCEGGDLTDMAINVAAVSLDLLPPVCA